MRARERKSPLSAALAYMTYEYCLVITEKIQGFTLTINIDRAAA